LFHEKHTSANWTYAYGTKHLKVTRYDYHFNKKAKETKLDETKYEKSVP